MQHQEQTKENCWDCAGTLFGPMRAHKTNESPIQALRRQPMIIALNAVRKVPPKAWLFCVNAAEEAVCPEEVFVLQAASQRPGKATGGFARTPVASIKPPRDGEGTGTGGGRERSAVLPQETRGLPEVWIGHLWGKSTAFKEGQGAYKTHYTQHIETAPGKRGGC